MAQVGFNYLLQDIPQRLINKKTDVLCRSVNDTPSYQHKPKSLLDLSLLKRTAISESHYSIFGKTWDNIIELEGGFMHPKYDVPIFRLNRKPRKQMKRMLNFFPLWVLE